jgi:hypothetical protein
MTSNPCEPQQERPPLLITPRTSQDRCREASLARSAQRKADWIKFLASINRGFCVECGWPRIEDMIFHATDFTSPEFSPRTLWQRSCNDSQKREAWKVLNRSQTLCEFCHGVAHRKYKEQRYKYS